MSLQPTAAAAGSPRATTGSPRARATAGSPSATAGSPRARATSGSPRATASIASTTGATGATGATVNLTVDDRWRVLAAGWNPAHRAFTQPIPDYNNIIRSIIEANREFGSARSVVNDFYEEDVYKGSVDTPEYKEYQGYRFLVTDDPEFIGGDYDHMRTESGTFWMNMQVYRDAQPGDVVGFFTRRDSYSSPTAAQTAASSLSRVVDMMRTSGGTTYLTANGDQVSSRRYSPSSPTSAPTPVSSRHPAIMDLEEREWIDGVDSFDNIVDMRRTSGGTTYLMRNGDQVYSRPQIPDHISGMNSSHPTPTAMHSSHPIPSPHPIPPGMFHPNVAVPFFLPNDVASAFFAANDPPLTTLLTTPPHPQGYAYALHTRLPHHLPEGSIAPLHIPKRDPGRLPFLPSMFSGPNYAIDDKPLAEILHQIEECLRQMNTDFTFHRDTFHFECSFEDRVTFHIHLYQDRTRLNRVIIEFQRMSGERVENRIFDAARYFLARSHLIHVPEVDAHGHAVAVDAHGNAHDHGPLRSMASFMSERSPSYTQASADQYMGYGLVNSRSNFTDTIRRGVIDISNLTKHPLGKRSLISRRDDLTHLFQLLHSGEPLIRLHVIQLFIHLMTMDPENTDTIAKQTASFFIEEFVRRHGGRMIRTILKNTTPFMKRQIKTFLELLRLLLPVSSAVSSAVSEVEVEVVQLLTEMRASEVGIGAPAAGMDVPGPAPPFEEPDAVVVPTFPTFSRKGKKSRNKNRNKNRKKNRKSRINA